MEAGTSTLTIALGSLVLVALLGWGIWRSLKNTILNQLAVTQAQLATAIEERTKAERELAVATTTASRVQTLEVQLAERLTEQSTVRDEKAEVQRKLAEAETRLADRGEKVAQLSAQLTGAVNALNELRKEHGDVLREKAILDQTLEQERAQSKEKLAFLDTAKVQFTDSFKALSAEVLRIQNEAFANESKNQVGGILDPLRQRLSEFQQNFTRIQTDVAEQRAALNEQVRSIAETGLKMVHETSSLTKALKGESKTQGAWGEMILESILERSGLREGDEYVVQPSHANEDGKRLRPDAIVHLPESRRVIIDAKVSLKAYESYVGSTDEEERQVLLRQHLASLRSHIKSLAGRRYQDLEVTDLDFVIMFVPVEGALALALGEDKELTVAAVDQNVGLATPATLMMALRTIGTVWRAHRRTSNAEQIARRAGLLFDKFVGFVDELQEVGKSISTAGSAYEEAMKKLSTGKGNLVGQVSKLKLLGATTTKSLPIDVEEDQLPMGSVASPGTAALS